MLNFLYLLIVLSQNLLKLKLIDLSDSQNLCQTPNFKGLPNIERLIFQGCTGLHALHESVGDLKRLTLLNLKDCKSLENLPHEIKLESLTILILSGCSKLKKFPRIGRNMTSMLELYLDGTAIEELPSSIKRLTGLTLLNLHDCKNLSIDPSVIPSLTSLEILILSGCKGQPPKERYLLGLIPTLPSIVATLNYVTAQHPEAEPISLLLPKLLSGLSSLVILNLSDCNLLDGSLPGDFRYLSSLKSLYLSNNNFTCLPQSISQLLNLKRLYMDHCSQLQSLPYLPLSTQFVSARGCTSLENYSNQVVVWSSDETVFTFINCLDLADDEEGKTVDVSLKDIHFQALWQRYIEVSLSLSLSLSHTHTHTHTYTRTHKLNIFLLCLLIFYRTKLIKLKVFASFYLKLKFQSASRLSVGHLYESHYLLIRPVTDVGKGSLYVSFLKSLKI